MPIAAQVPQDGRDLEAPGRLGQLIDTGYQGRISKPYLFELRVARRPG